MGSVSPSLSPPELTGTEEESSARTEDLEIVDVETDWAAWGARLVCTVLRAITRTNRKLTGRIGN